MTPTWWVLTGAVAALAGVWSGRRLGDRWRHRAEEKKMTDIVRATTSVTDAVREQYGGPGGASDALLEVFAAAARHLQLSIPAGEIELVPFDGNNKVIHITIDGRRTIAQRTGRLRGISPPEWCGPRQFDTDGAKLPLDWEEVWTGDGTPYAARVYVAVDGWDYPANGTCKYSEFSKTTGIWTKSPSHMLAKCAEALALRRGFSAEIGKALADLADITGDYRAVDEDTGEITPPPPGPEPRQDLATGRPGPAFALADPDGSRQYKESPFRRKQPPPTPPTPAVEASEPPPGKPADVASTPARPPAAPKPDNNTWRDGTPMFDPQTGKPI